jgi:hypothetical protein
MRFSRTTAFPQLHAVLLRLLDPQIAEAIGLSLLAVMLNAHRATGILVILDVCGDHAVDLDLDFLPLARDAVLVPFVAFKAVARALAKGGDAFLAGPLFLLGLLLFLLRRIRRHFLD